MAVCINIILNLNVVRFGGDAQAHNLSKCNVYTKSFIHIIIDFLRTL